MAERVDGRTEVSPKSAYVIYTRGRREAEGGMSLIAAVVNYLSCATKLTRSIREKETGPSP